MSRNIVNHIPDMKFICKTILYNARNRKFHTIPIRARSERESFFFFCFCSGKNQRSKFKSLYKAEMQTDPLYTLFKNHQVVQEKTILKT